MKCFIKRWLTVVITELKNTNESGFILRIAKMHYTHTHRFWRLHVSMCYCKHPLSSVPKTLNIYIFFQMWKVFDSILSKCSHFPLIIGSSGGVRKVWGAMTKLVRRRGRNEEIEEMRRKRNKWRGKKSHLSWETLQGVMKKDEEQRDGDASTTFREVAFSLKIIPKSILVVYFFYLLKPKHLFYFFMFTYTGNVAKMLAWDQNLYI